MITPKLSSLEPGFLSSLSDLAQKHKAINLADGVTDFHCSPRLIELVVKHMTEGINRLAPIAGVMELRERVAEKIESLYGYRYKPETEITITAGSIQAYCSIISSLIGEGDEVIVFEPAVESYAPAIELAGGKAVFIPLKEPDFHIDWEEVQKMVNSNTRMIIINSPHNPTGAVLNELDMLRLQKIINGTKIVILSDEIFEHMVYDEMSHQSVALYPKLAAKSVIVASFGENYHVSGWQVGYCVAPADLMKEIRKVHQIIVHSVNAPLQYALADFLQEKEQYRELATFYQGKRDLFQQLMSNTKFEPIPTNGTFYQLYRYNKISSERDKDFANRLIKEFGVAAVPISAFYHEKSKKQLLRFNFAKSDENLRLTAERLSLL